MVWRARRRRIGEKCRFWSGRYIGKLCLAQIVGFLVKQAFARVAVDL